MRSTTAESRCQSLGVWGVGLGLQSELTRPSTGEGCGFRTVGRLDEKFSLLATAVVHAEDIHSPYALNQDPQHNSKTMQTIPGPVP